MILISVYYCFWNVFKPLIARSTHERRCVAVSDFTQQLSHIYEHHAEEMQLLVSNFRKRNAELRKER
jgi:hypothetical protein